MKNNPIFLCRIISLLFIFIFLQKSFSQNVIFDSLANEINKTAIFNKTKAKEMLNELSCIAYQNPDCSLNVAHCLYEESQLNYCQKIVDTLLKNRIIKQLEHSDLSTLEQSILRSALGINLTSEGKYAEAFTIQWQTLEIFKQLRNNRYIASTLNALGNICVSIQLHNLAEYYYSEACVYTAQNLYRYYFIRVSTSILLSYNNKDAALDSLLHLVDVVEEKHIEELLPVIYLNIGSLLLDTLPEKALTYFAKMQTLNFDNPSMTGTLYANIGIYHLNKNCYAQALLYLKEAMKIMENNNDFYNLPHLYDDLFFIYEQQHQYDSALLYAKKSKELTLQLHSNLVALETYQEYITTFLEVSKNELIIAEQTIKLKHRQFVIFSILAIFSILVILLLLRLVNQQKLRKASENRELLAKLKHEKRVKEYEKNQRKLEKEKQKAVMDAKHREITSYSLLVSNKNQMLGQIQELTVQLLDNKENTDTIAQKIDKIIKNNLNIDTEWENFKMHFDKVHPHFFEKLKQQHPDLTEDNLKMCVYIKMRITNKQIAQLLQVTHGSILTNRYRLKKKLNLGEQEDLEGYIDDM